MSKAIRVLADRIRGLERTRPRLLPAVVTDLSPLRVLCQGAVSQAVAAPGAVFAVDDPVLVLRAQGSKPVIVNAPVGLSEAGIVALVEDDDSALHAALVAWLAGQGGGGGGGGLNWRGDWDYQASYQEGDLVHSLGVSWLCIEDQAASPEPPTAPVYRGATTATSTGAANFSLAAPSGTMPGDRQYLLIAANSGSIAGLSTSWDLIWSAYSGALALYTRSAPGTAAPVTFSTAFNTSAVLASYSDHGLDTPVVDSVNYSTVDDLPATTTDWLALAFIFKIIGTPATTFTSAAPWTVRASIASSSVTGAHLADASPTGGSVAAASLPMSGASSSQQWQRVRIKAVPSNGLITNFPDNWVQLGVLP